MTTKTPPAEPLHHLSFLRAKGLRRALLELAEAALIFGGGVLILALLLAAGGRWGQ